jgi:putative acetyltransferase
MQEEFLVRLAQGPSDIAAVQDLWREYWKSIGLPDNFQGFGEELASLPGVYGADGGVLLLAWKETTAAGTIALRRLDDHSGEIKRLYLRPAFRGRGLGRYLVDQAIDQERGMGYHTLYADTLPSMTDALNLYARLGFEQVPAYATDPTPGAVYLRLNLT